MKTTIINYPDLKKAAKRDKNQSKTIYIAHLNDDKYKNVLANKSFFIHTYGCQANVRDSETMAGILSMVGMNEVMDKNEADVIIINTCAVRENAEDKVYGEVGNLKSLKRKKKDLIIALCGCMVEQPIILNYLMEKFKEINLFFGTHEIAQLPDLLLSLINKNERIVSIESKMGEVVEENACIRSHKFKAFVNIMYGCDKFCTYCIVPYTRGKERSRSIEDVMKEVDSLIAQGYQEITFLGQNVNAYGKDLAKGYDFADLLEQAAKKGVPRIRFTTSHPWDFTDKMIDVIAKYDNIMKFIHLPVQSGSNDILRKMNRKYTREGYLSLVKKMRERIPDLSLSTDIIVGFPNETEEEFENTLSLVDIVKYEAAFTFIYSPRKGTPAANMADNVTYEDKVKRFKRLVEHLERSISEDSLRYIGNTYDVLVDSISKNNESMLSGYTRSNKLVHFKGDISLIGKIIKVKINESHTYALIGEVVNE